MNQDKRDEAIDALRSGKVLIEGYDLQETNITVGDLKDLTSEVRQLRAERERREELEVVAAALYLGHDDAKEQFDMYRAVYLSGGDK